MSSIWDQQYDYDQLAADWAEFERIERRVMMTNGIVTTDDGIELQNVQAERLYGPLLISELGTNVSDENPWIPSPDDLKYTDRIGFSLPAKEDELLAWYRDQGVPYTQDPLDLISKCRDECAQSDDDEDIDLLSLKSGDILHVTLGMAFHDGVPWIPGPQEISDAKKQWEAVVPAGVKVIVTHQGHSPRVIRVK